MSSQFNSFWQKSHRCPLHIGLGCLQNWSGRSRKMNNLYKIWGFHGDDYEERRLLGYYVVWLLLEPTFGRNVSGSVVQLLVTANVVPRSLVLFALSLEAICSSEMPVLTKATRRNIAEDDILQSPQWRLQILQNFPCSPQRRHAVAYSVEALCYKQADHGFEWQWCQLTFQFI
jgi:hypothetical protein